MILTKRLLIIILLSTFISCGFKELNNLNIYNSSKNKIENPYFSNKKIDYNYIVKIEINKKNINGIISIKKIDSIYHRIVFMSGFNQFYYSFSPIVADFEREQPIFKEIMKVSLTPMLSSLSLLNYVDIDSEQEMLGYGISLIALNLGMYIGLPAFGILKLYQIRKN